MTENQNIVCEACKNLGAELPEYIVHGEDIMVKFTALESAKVTNGVTNSVTNGVTNLQDTDEQKILDILTQSPKVTYEELSRELKISRKTVSQKIKLLKEKGLIARIGSTRGYWKRL